MRRVALLLVALVAAGCTAPAAEQVPSLPTNALQVGGALLHADANAGAFSLLHLGEGEGASVTFGPGVLVLDAEGRLVPATQPVALAPGDIARFVPPYGAESIEVTVDGETRTLALADGPAFVSGERVIDLLKVQRDQFPRRTPGMENYSRSVEYFADFFRDLGYEVELVRAPLVPAVGVPVGPAPSTQSVTSVVAYKRGTLEPERYIGFGGHFDVVEQVTHGAYDNTAGTVATLAMAEAFAQVNTSRSLFFAAWGGEEDGILGSQAWITAHPELVPFIDLYVNFDVTGLAWPAPLAQPAPVVVATGPDGAIAGVLAQQHAQVAEEYLQLEGAEFVYEPVVQGQATGAGVNAQSDHTPFMARGVPSVFQFTQDVQGAFNLIHKEADTVENMTAYALLGPEGVGQELDAQQVREGEAALADSFETQTMGAFYLAALLDAESLPPARPASLPEWSTSVPEP